MNDKENEEKAREIIEKETTAIRAEVFQKAFGKEWYKPNFQK